MSELLGVPIDARLVVVLLAVTIAGLLRGFVGFGAALISVPVFSLVLGPHAAIAVNAMMGLPAVFQLLPEAIRRAERPFVLPICIATFVAAPIGTWALVAADAALITVAISALVLLMVTILATGWRLKGRIGIGTLIGAGVAGGLVQGVAGVGGPPVVAVALSRFSTIPVVGVLEAKNDFAGHALELRILRMLALFGLLEARKDPNPPNRFFAPQQYRKTALYDRFFSFDVRLEPIEMGTRH